MSMSRSVFTVLTLSLGAASLPQQASAFVRTQTCDGPSPFACAPGEAPSFLQWPSSCVRYHLNPNPGEDLNAGDYEEAIRESFEVWNEVECSELSLLYGGETDEDRIGFVQGAQNANIIVIRDDVWRHPEDILALTSVTFNPLNGNIADADIEINDVNFRLTTDKEDVSIDIVNTIAHEAGHFLGLDHSLNRNATMFATAPPGETSKRDLDDDDVDGVCEIYPPGGAPSSACIGAREGFYSRDVIVDCDSQSFALCDASAELRESSGPCSVARPGRSPASPWSSLALFGALGLVWAWRRRRAGRVSSVAGVAAPRGVVAGVALLASLGVTAPASAFVRTVTCTPSGPSACEPGEAPLELFWPSRSVRYHLSEIGSDDTDPDRANSAIVSSFEAWNEPTCSDIVFVFGGFTNEDRVGYNPFTGQAGNANVIMFRNSQWDHDNDALALTSVTFSPTSGRIFDADIELNGRDYRFTTTDVSTRAVIDVANTVTHEVGHFLGLDHTIVEGATMLATAPNQELSKRTLERDDIDGLCDIYPLGTGQSAETLGAPEGFFERPEFGPEDGPPPQQARTCSTLPMGRPLQSVWWPLVLIGLVHVGRQRR